MSDETKMAGSNAAADDVNNEHQHASQQRTEKRWTPNKERKVRSKKSYDKARIEKMMADDAPAYNGELDPRKKDQAGKPISKRASAARAADESEVGNRYGRTDEASDFRSRYNPCNASPARMAALAVTQEVRKRNAYAQSLIETMIDSSRLSAQDRAFATLLVLGVVSTWGTLDDIINRCLENPRDIKPDVRDAMRISTYEIFMLKKAPHAALDQGVELVRAVAPSAAGLGNAVLHRILASQPDFPFGDPKTDIEALARYYAFPTWLAHLFVDDLGAHDASALMAAAAEPAPVYIAVNALRASDDEIIEAFAALDCVLEPAESGGIVPLGCYRVDKPRVIGDGRIRNLFTEGKIIASDASSQAIVYCALENGYPETFLEIGAGRGTKTILLQSASSRLYGRQMGLTCMDSRDFKEAILADRAKAYGARVSETITGNAMRLERHVGERTFDRIFIDAPCTGLGTLRRHQEIRWRIAPEAVENLSAKGLAMLKSAASHVSVGGDIVYSTCTVTRGENIEVAKRFLESEEGQSFKLGAIGGKAYFASLASPGAPDAHFAVRFVKQA